MVPWFPSCCVGAAPHTRNAAHLGPAPPSCPYTQTPSLLLPAQCFDPRAQCASCQRDISPRTARQHLTRNRAQTKHIMCPRQAQPHFWVTCPRGRNCCCLSSGLADRVALLWLESPSSLTLSFPCRNPASLWLPASSSSDPGSVAGLPCPNTPVTHTLPRLPPDFHPPARP